MASQPKDCCSPAAYLRRERQAPVKREYNAGAIFARSGASREHNLSVANVTTLLNLQLAQRECEVYPGDMRVRPPDSTLYTYPDVVVVCGQPQFEDDYFDTLLNPTLLVEVLSPSTETYDRTRKFATYRKIEALSEYLLIAQAEWRVTQYFKQCPDWLFREASSLAETVDLVSVDCRLVLEQVYQKVRFPEPGVESLI